MDIPESHSVAELFNGRMPRLAGDMLDIVKGRHSDPIVEERAWTLAGGTVTTDVSQQPLPQPLVGTHRFPFLGAMDKALPLPLLEKKYPHDVGAAVQRWADKHRLALLLADTPGLETLHEDLLSSTEEGRVQVSPFFEDSFSDIRETFRSDAAPVFRSISKKQITLHRSVFEATVGPGSDPAIMVPRVPHAAIEESKMYIRWMIRRDMAEVMNIEQGSYHFPWREDTFIDALRERNVIGMVAEQNERVVGFMIYALHRRFLRVMNMAVHPEHRNDGVGKAMLDKLIHKLSDDRRTAMGLVISPFNDNALQFFLNKGMVLQHWKHNAFDEPAQPGMILRYDIRPDIERNIPFYNSYGGALIHDLIGRPPMRVSEDREEEDETKDEVTCMHATSVWAPLLLRAQKSPKARQRLSDAFQRWLTGHRGDAIDESMRQAWHTIGSIREVTDAEWQQYRVRSNQESYARREPPAKTEDGLRALQSVVGCRRHEREMKRLRRSKNIEGLDAHEKAAAYEVFAAVMKYPYGSHIRDPDRIPAYVAGTPKHVMEKRAVNCFTAPWVMASMLLQCGIPYNQLFFARINDPDLNCFDGHCALLMRTHNNSLLLLDGGLRRVNPHLRLSYATSEDDKKRMSALLGGHSDEPTIFSIPKRTAKTFKLPNRLQVAPLLEGFAAVHMLHTGLSLRHEGKFDEAQQAFHAGLGYNALDPNLHYELGLAAFMEHDIAKAKKLLHQALTLDPDLLFSHFTLGEIALSQGNTTEARKRFKRYADDPRMAHGDSGIMKERAKRYLSMTDEKMLAAWQAAQAAIDRNS